MKRLLLWYCCLVLLVACGEQREAPSTVPPGAAQAPEQMIVGTWQVYNDPANTSTWIFDSNNAVYIEQAQNVYEERTYEFGDDGRQLAIKSGQNIDFYSFTLDANQLTLIERSTNTTTFFQKVSETATKPDTLR